MVVLTVTVPFQPLIERLARDTFAQFFPDPQSAFVRVRSPHELIEATGPARPRVVLSIASKNISVHSQSCGSSLTGEGPFSRAISVIISATTEQVKTLIVEEEHLSPALKANLEALLLLATLLLNLLGLQHNCITIRLAGPSLRIPQENATKPLS